MFETKKKIGSASDKRTIMEKLPETRESLDEWAEATEKEVGWGLLVVNLKETKKKRAIKLLRNVCRGRKKASKIK